MTDYRNPDAGMIDPGANIGGIDPELVKRVRAHDALDAVKVATPPTAATLQAQADTAARIAKDLAQQAAAARRAEIEASRPQMPDVGGEGDRAIVCFTKYQSGREYNYAAIGWRQGRSVRWAVTGQTTDRMNWPGLLSFIGEANWPSLHSMTEDRLLGPLPGQEAPVRERMGSYGRVLSQEHVADIGDVSGRW